jgi:hypothetical protein
MLYAVPDLRQTLKTGDDDELAEIFRAFDVRITYDKSRQVLDFAATITPELLPALPNESDRPEERAQDKVAGAGSKPVPATERSPNNSKSSMPPAVAHRIQGRWDLVARSPILDFSDAK